MNWPQVLSVAVTATLLMAACTDSGRFDASGETMGTVYRVQAYCARPAADLAEQIAAELEAVNDEMSTYRSTPKSRQSCFHSSW